MPRKSSPHLYDTLSSAMLPPVPLPGRQPTWWAAIADLRKDALLGEMPLLDSRAGQEGGALLCANSGDMQVDLTDAEFKTYIHMRLGLQVCKHHRC